MGCRPSASRHNDGITPEHVTALRKLVDATYGPGTSEELEQARLTRQLQQQEYGQRGIEELNGILNKNRLPVEDEHVQMWENQLTTIFNRDENLRHAFWNPATQKRAIEEGFKVIRDKLINPSLAAVGAAKLQEYAARRERVVGSSRGAVPPPKPREFKPTSTGPAAREVELAKWREQEIDRILDEHGQEF